jgi:hypothetical protein
MFNWRELVARVLECCRCCTSTATSATNQYPRRSEKPERRFSFGGGEGAASRPKATQLPASPNKNTQASETFPKPTRKLRMPCDTFRKHPEVSKATTKSFRMPPEKLRGVSETFRSGSWKNRGVSERCGRCPEKIRWYFESFGKPA